MMTHCSDPRDAIELLVLRERMRDWRFYDHLRTDRDAAARRPQIGTHTPVLAGDGSDLAAAVQTIREIGDADEMDERDRRRLPGRPRRGANTDGYFELEMLQHGLLRPLKAAELSDGTLRYLLLVAALLSPRPPALMVLNEPETSLHPDLLPPLARLVAQAAEAIADRAGLARLPRWSPHSMPRPAAGRSCCEKQFGETLVAGSCAAVMDVALAMKARRPIAGMLSASSSRRGLRAAPSRSRLPTSVRRSRGASEWRRRGPSGRPD